MNIKGLLEKYNDKQILNRLVEIYPDQKKNVKGYKNLLRSLRKIKPEPKRLIILPSKWHTGGRDKKGEVFGIQFVKWQEWLGMNIKTKVHGLTVLCWCLWEMTWSGFSQQKIQGTVRGFSKTIEKAKKEINKTKVTTP